MVPTTPLTTPSPVIALPVIAAMAAEEVIVADLTRHLKQAFEEISLGANYPMPMFHGKKGENPEDHCMKAEDCFKVYKITRDEDKRKCFTDTLFLTARRWLSSYLIQSGIMSLIQITKIQRKSLSNINSYKDLL